MAHFKCSRCRSRVQRDLPAADAVDQLCPGCGDPLEAVADLSELIGLRSLQPRDAPVRRTREDRSARISRQIRETIAQHDAERRRRTSSFE
jgi:hypothetical protein